MGHSFIFFEEENYLLARYELVKEVRISQVFFQTLLTICQEDINHHHDAGWLALQVYLANSEVDRVDCHKDEGQIYLKL